MVLSRHIDLLLVSSHDHPSNHRTHHGGCSQPLLQTPVHHSTLPPELPINAHWRWLTGVVLLNRWSSEKGVRTMKIVEEKVLTSTNLSQDQDVNSVTDTSISGYLIFSVFEFVVTKINHLDITAD